MANLKIYLPAVDLHSARWAK